ncbi:class I SAM-dependent methyltransferase [Mesorhizobium sp. CU2]|uniref:SAM-dependent methyltransferase n=1 Tax=unclassified Mesorhizobium TaxID=325217 RepID=UPI00112B8A45|nr:MULTISPECIES: cyclopropane-fatty-acyl-phospholipid synthase family protein [unclassified Mesorhizobium]TPN81861.1 class I SAM-dependent methyltransferase [Mesorhizobium sp. CU3]TPO11052.1 class I SAM-dependent methyltransferase [Mesorhizobium sp. CU2]
MSLDTETRTKADLRSGIFVGPVLKRLLGCLKVGKITVRMPNGATLDHQTGRPGPEATVALHRWRALRRLLTGGDIAFAEAYMDGDWSSPDLPALLELAAVNIAEIEHAITGLLPVRLFNRARHLLRANSRSGSKRNIAFHYDLGNDFYRLWLDPSMTYSSALYRADSDTLEEAQDHKLDRIAELLAPSPGAEVLEIGCGWGTLAARLAKAGADVKGITLSTEQLACARETAERENVCDQACFELQDYRDCHGAFDRIVSIEMLEAVGEQYWPVYFDRLRQLLKADGKAVLQVITIDDSRFEFYRKGADFIQRYIFPGGMLPTKALIASHAEKAGLKLVASECFGDSYARTLAEWRTRFRQNSGAVQALGFDQRFRRLWDYYLAYCEAGFRAGTIDVGLFVLQPDRN